MPWVCTPTGLPAATPVLHALPVPFIRHTVGHGFWRTLRHWGAPPVVAMVSWHCLWVGPAAAGAGGAAYGIGRWLSGIGGGVAGGAVGALAPGGVVAVPEPSSLAVLALGVAVPALVRGRRA